MKLRFAVRRDTLRKDAVQKVSTDQTTLAEVIRCVWIN